MKKTAQILPALFPFFLVIGCARCTPVAPEKLFDCFLSPTQKKFAAFSEGKYDAARLDSAMRSARGSAGTGRERVWLTDSTGVRYLLGYSAPAGMRSDTLYPLVIYLHGGTGTDRNDKGDTAYTMLSALADTFRLFLASPSANCNAPWWSGAGLSRILQTLRFMTLHFPVNPDKVLLAGVSDGATGCYAAAGTVCAPFAGFIAVSGFGGMLSSFGVMLEYGNMKRRPIYNVNGGLDRLYPVSLVNGFVQSLQEKGVPINSNIHMDEPHGFDYRYSEMGALATCIRSWSRPPDKGISWTFTGGVPNLPDCLLEWSLSSDKASIRAFWRHDTLMVRTRGVRSFTAEFPDAEVKGKIICRITADGENERVKKIFPAKTRYEQELRFMVKRCFPGKPGTAPVYTIRCK